MHRQNFARVSGVIVDTCKGHGVWFNQGELRRVVEFIRAGGMDRARDREKDGDARTRGRASGRPSSTRGRAGARVPGHWRSGRRGATGDVEILSAVRGLIDWLS